jgi:hypothetical protein
LEVEAVIAETFRESLKLEVIIRFPSSLGIAEVPNYPAAT